MEIRKSRIVQDQEENQIEVDYFSFISLPNLSELIGSKEDEVLLMGIS